MTKEEINKAYLDYYHFKVLKGSLNNLTIFLPVLVMDMCYQLYTKEIAPMRCSFELKKWKNKWRTSYNAFNREFFRVFNQEQEEYIVDKMDDFESYISYHITVARVAVLDVLRKEGVEDDRQEVLSACVICNILAQTAQVMWRNIHQADNGKEETNNNILGVERATMKFMDVYHSSSKNINLNAHPVLSQSVDILCKEMIRWLSLDSQKEDK